MGLPRAVITGYGCLSPLGDTAAETWVGMAEGRSGIGPVTHFDLEDLTIRIGGQVKRDVTDVVPVRRRAMYDRFSLLAIAAAQDALAHSGLEITEENAPRCGTVIGVGNCGWEAVEEGFRRAFIEGKRRAKIFSVPRAMPSAPACNVSMQLGLKGPVFGVTSACSSSNHAFASALQMIRSGQCDVVLAGGSEAPVMFGVLKAWEALRIVAPEMCQPFDLNRKGLILAEGSGAVVLESLEHAKARGATIYAELAGSGSSADAGDLVIPTPEGPIRAILVVSPSFRNVAAVRPRAAGKRVFVSNSLIRELLK
jgi:nodulation protein E